MVPRTRVTYLDADATLDDLRAASRRTGHSRFPVRGVDDDDVVGTVHIKDVLSVPPADRATHARRGHRGPGGAGARVRAAAAAAGAAAARPSAPSPLVIDEFGGVAGIVTVEDVVEELVGRDRGRVRPTASARCGGSAPTGGWSTAPSGSTRSAELLGTSLPEGEYETIAGFVIDRLGRIPVDRCERHRR